MRGDSGRRKGVRQCVESKNIRHREFRFGKHGQFELVKNRRPIQTLHIDLFSNTKRYGGKPRREGMMQSKKSLMQKCNTSNSHHQGALLLFSSPHSTTIIRNTPDSKRNCNSVHTGYTHPNCFLKFAFPTPRTHKGFQFRKRQTNFTVYGTVLDNDLNGIPSESELSQKILNHQKIVLLGLNIIRNMFWHHLKMREANYLHSRCEACAARPPSIGYETAIGFPNRLGKFMRRRR